jgi:hypothetical protein
MQRAGNTIKQTESAQEGQLLYLDTLRLFSGPTVAMAYNEMGKTGGFSSAMLLP